MSFVGKLQWFFKLKWKSYAVAITLISFVMLLNIIPPRMIGNVIDQIRIGEMTRAQLTQTVSLLVGLAILNYIMVYIWITTLFSSSGLLEKLLRHRLLTHLTRLTPTFFQRNRTGELMALATNDILAIGNTAGFGVLTFVNTVIGTSSVLVVMVLFISYKLMLAALLPLPFLVYAINRIGKVMRRRFLQSQEAFGKMNDHALESISGMRVLRSYVQEADDVKAFDRVTKDVMNKNIQVSMLSSLFQPVISTLVGLSYSIGLGYGSYLVFHGEITLGQLVTFNIYLGLLVWPMISFGEFINVLQRGNASVDRIEKAFAQQPDVTNKALIIHKDHPTRIEMKELSFTYPGSTQPSLNQISFKVEQGETLGIVGRTGSGKSTLLKQLLRQYPITSGQLYLSDISIDELDIEQVKSWIGYVPQEHMLLSKSIADNIKLGHSKATDAQLWQCIKMASFTKDVEQMPDGLQTIVGENGVMLSGGQKQRVAIARALLVDPEILILDDALSAVDAKTESTILNHIRKARVGKTTLIATHRLSAVSHAEWIIVLDNGRIVEEGSHEQLMLFDGWYKRQYVRQQMESSLWNEVKGGELE